MGKPNLFSHRGLIKQMYALEHEHNVAVQEKEATENGTLKPFNVTIEATYDATVEVWAASKESAQFKAIYDLDICQSDLDIYAYVKVKP